jgi:hypothetical protein
LILHEPPIDIPIDIPVLLAAAALAVEVMLIPPIDIVLLPIFMLKSRCELDFRGTNIRM